ncbi:hypothetical protein CEXT_212101 [Caerostris extrusa]|uniref:Uncharacterized protein n=1 Tax=Caerostris extrusa TaxID=172846 RepID=A0AAV4ND22_CAEEX|nr:hypothetical protein CEXT_212101 [Caerostris extrusa]
MGRPANERNCLQIKEKLFSVKTAIPCSNLVFCGVCEETLEIFVKCDRAERMMTGNKYICGSTLCRIFSMGCSSEYLKDLFMGVKCLMRRGKNVNGICVKWCSKFC